MTHRQSAGSRQPRRLSSRGFRRVERRGGAALELAIVLPLVLLIFFGTIDALGMMFVKQSLSLAAYESSRLAAKDDVTSEEVEAACQKLLAARGVNNAVVRTIPEDVETAAAGEMIQVEVEVAFGDSDLYFARLHKGRTAKISFTAMKRGARDIALKDVDDVDDVTGETIDQLPGELDRDLPTTTSILQ